MKVRELKEKLGKMNDDSDINVFINDEKAILRGKMSASEEDAFDIAVKKFLEDD